MENLRVGKISSLNYEKGTARVVYTDRDDCVTAELPFLAEFEEYYLPEVDDLVWVLHMPGGSSVKGLILGRYWSKNHTPPDGAKQGLRRKDYSRKQGSCYTEYDDPEVGEGNEGKSVFHNDNDAEVTIDGKADVEVKGDVSLKSEGAVQINGATQVKVESDGSVTISGGSGLTLSCNSGITISGNSLTVIDGVNFRTHTHNCTAPGTPSGPPI